MTYQTEDAIERAVEWRMNALDRKLMRSELTQQQYDAAVRDLNTWADGCYRVARFRSDSPSVR